MKAKMKLVDAVELYLELTGVSPKQKGLLNENISMKAKYNFSKTVKALEFEKEQFESERRKLFEKYGETVGDNINIKPENVEKYRKEYAELANIEVEVELRKVAISEMDFKSENVYPMTFEFLIKE